MAFSYYLRDLLNRHFFIGETLNSPITSPYGTGAYLGMISEVYDFPDSYAEISGNAYTRMPLSLMWDSTNYLLRQTSDIYFPRATPSGWGVVRGLVIYNTVSGTNMLFDLPWWQTSTGPKVTSYTVAAGQRPYFLAANTDIKLSIHGKEPISTSNGGISVQYAGIISQWIMNLAPVPYARTYNVALGRTLDFDSHGRFAGVWQECSGYGYQRMPILASNWENMYQYGGGVRNINEIVFPLATGTWGTMTYIVLYPTDAPEVPAFWGYLETPTNIFAGDTFAIGPQSLNISWQGEFI